MNVIVVLGAVGYLMMKAGFSMPPMALGFVLGPTIENNLQRALISGGLTPAALFTSPLSIGIWVVSIGLTLWMFIRNRKTKG